MLFGQWQDQNDRQRKAIKSKMYKEMLDNQILINQRYKYKKANNKQYQQHSQIVQKNTNHLEKKNAKNIHNDLNLSILDVKRKDKNINLPSIKDKNTYYQGSSKFIKVENVALQPVKQSHLKTQLIQQQDDELDEYNTTCQKIIRELQSINKQTPKMKLRRKLYQYSDLAPNKKRYQKTRIEQLKNGEGEAYNKYEYTTKKTNRNQDNSFENISIKPTAGSEDRVPSFNIIKPSKQTKNDQSTKSKRVNTQPSKPTPIIPTLQRSKPKQQYKHLPINEFDESQEIDENEKPNKKIELASVSKENTSPNKSNALQKNRIKSYVDVNNKSSSIMVQSQKQDQKLDDAQIKVHKQNFIDLLRKVKNRGQSLYIKLSGLPLTKNQIK